MYIDSSSRKGANGQVYDRHLLRASFRENGKVKKRTIANISNCSAEEISAIKVALQHKHDICELGSITDDVGIQQGCSFGATYLLLKIAERQGLCKFLGNSRDGKLALWQVISRVMGQGSRLSSVRLAENHSAAALLDTTSFNENHLYKNLDWLAENQEKIELSLFKHRHKQKTEFFLYDITSSYLEGTQNELANWGYNRDKKNGKMQIVVGLLCDSQGLPLSIEVFEGNTSDCTTVGRQMNKIAERWGCETITIIGDKGMIQGPQIKEIESANHTFITTIAKGQIKSIVVSAGYQTTLIDEDLFEFIHEGYRYIVRRNPVQAEKTADKRNVLLSVLKHFVQSENAYLLEHTKATAEKAAERVQKKIKKFKLGKISSVASDCRERTLILHIDNDALEEASKLDGCYAMKTNIGVNELPKEEVQSKYKDLALVEDAFRCSKTELLEMRPIHVRLEKRTRGHVFVVMLAYLLTKELEKCWVTLDMTAEEGIDLLKGYQTVDLIVKDKVVARQVPKPNATTEKLLELAGVKPPKSIPASDAVVVTRKKLGIDRKKTVV